MIYHLPVGSNTGEHKLLYYSSRPRCGSALFTITAVTECLRGSRAAFLSKLPADLPWHFLHPSLLLYRSMHREQQDLVRDHFFNIVGNEILPPY